MSNATVLAVAACPTHGRQSFVRVAGCNWWECPEIGMLEPGSCGSVIPDEQVTPDGAEVLHWSQSRWVPTSTGKRRIWVSA